MLEKFEKTLVEQMKDWPHLPDRLTKWLVTNAWWLVLIGIVVGVISTIAMISGVAVGSALINYYVLRPSFYGGYVLSSWLAIIGMAVMIVVDTMAISPLKATDNKSRKRGWDLLFLAATISFAVSVIANLINLDVLSLLSTAIVATIVYYILIEIRTQIVKATARPAPGKTEDSKTQE